MPSGLLGALAGLIVTAPFAVAHTAPPAAPHATTVFSFEDPAIVEASNLVVQGGLFLTTNDSGDTGRVFAVDRSGATVGVTHWSDDPVDTEGLAPGGPGHVWVGDIGDNLATRRFVTVTRVPVGRGERTVHAPSYRLTYPHGPVDAETLIRNPTTGRLYIADKNIFGGTLYAVPAHLSSAHVNRLRAVGPVLGFATDGAFFPDGRHLVVRNYTMARIYDWPSLRRVGTFALPSQQQGEGIAVGPKDTLYLSSEGVRAPVLATRVPARLRTAMARSDATSSPSPSPSADSAATAGADPGDPATVASDTGTTEAGSSQTWLHVAGLLFGLAAVALVAVLAVAYRPARRRKVTDSD